MAALALLIALQYVVAWTSVRLPSFERLVKSQPSQLVRDGEFCRHAMRQQRVSEGEIQAAMRQHGLAGVHHASAVVLESDGSLSVITTTTGTPADRGA